MCCVPAYAWGIRAARPALRARANLDDDPGIRLVPPREWSTPKPAGWTRFVCFSDTHGLHDQIPSGHQPAGDVLLHAGDFTCIGRHEQVESFGLWTAGYPCTDKVVIAGNHDITFDEQYYTARGAERHGERPYDCTLARGLLAGTGCTYLQDELVEVQGYTIYGSPWQPGCRETETDWVSIWLEAPNPRRVGRQFPPLLTC